MFINRKLLARDNANLCNYISWLFMTNKPRQWWKASFGRARSPDRGNYRWITERSSKQILWLACCVVKAAGETTHARRIALSPVLDSILAALRFEPSQFFLLTRNVNKMLMFALGSLTFCKTIEMELQKLSLVFLVQPTVQRNAGWDKNSWNNYRIKQCGIEMRHSGLIVSSHSEKARVWFSGKT